MDLTPTRLEEFVFEDDATLEVLQNVVANDNLLPAARVPPHTARTQDVLQIIRCLKFLKTLENRN
jgi:hypothetical protein